MIFIAGQRKFHGKPGMVNGRRAVQILGAEKEKESLKNLMVEVDTPNL